MASRTVNQVEPEHFHPHPHSHGLGQLTLPGPGSIGLAFGFGFGLLTLFVGVEFAAGLLSNSLALLSDAVHNLTDALALAFNWWAIRLARRTPNFSKTYGYQRAGILAATLNGATLLFIAFYIFYEALPRLFNPPTVQSGLVIGVASAALLVNLGVAGLLLRWRKHDLNSRSAFLHIIWDAVASLGVILAGLAQYFLGWKAADPLVSLLLALLILGSGWGIIKEASHILLEASPAELDMVSLVRDLIRQPGVSDVHDLHVWTIGSNQVALSCHVVVSETVTLSEANQTLQRINTMLKTRYQINHATLQIECDACDFDHKHCAVPPTRR